MKVFISQPMTGKTKEEIMQTRQEVVDVLKRDYPMDTIDVIDTINNNLPDGINPLIYLGYDIGKLAEADLIYFAKGWQQSKGCSIEYHCATTYKIPMILTGIPPMSIHN